MLFRFWCEFIIGIITLISVLIFGQKGMVAFVLMAFIPLVMRIKNINPDEREKQLFYKSTLIIIQTIVLIIIVCALIWGLKIFDLSQIDGKLLGIGAGVLIIIVSSVRLFYFYKNE